MPILKTQSIVLRRFPIRETSLIAVLFTKDFGKIHGIFKGIRKDPKKFASPVDIFSVNEIVFYKSRNSSLHLVSQCELQAPMFMHSWDRQRIEAAGYVLRLTESLLPQWHKNEGLYNLLIDTLHLVSHIQDPNYVFTAYDIKALALTGFKPHIDSCVSCGNDVEKDLFFSVNQGGILCRNCLSRDSLAEPIMPAVVKAIRQINAMPIEKCGVLKLSQRMYNELTYIVHKFLEYHLDIKARHISQKAGAVC